MMKLVKTIAICSLTLFSVAVMLQTLVSYICPVDIEGCEKATLNWQVEDEWRSCKSDNQCEFVYTPAGYVSINQKFRKKLGRGEKPVSPETFCSKYFPTICKRGMGTSEPPPGKVFCVNSVCSYK